jgi:DNA-binding NarL/FixJ family response regulator
VSHEDDNRLMNARILLVEDHPVMCAGLRLTLEQEEGVKVVGQAHNGRAALAEFQELSPDLVVMDIDLGDADGIAIARKMLAESPQTTIIIFSALLAPDVVDRAILAGVRGYLVKGKSENELIQAVRAVQAGNSYLCAEVTGALVANYRKMLAASAVSAKPLLTNRELEVLKLTAGGLRVKEIANRLDIGIKTVDTHRSSLLAKLGCSSAAELTRYAIREGIIAP